MERGRAAAAAMATAGASEGSEPGSEPGSEQGCEHYRRGCRLRVGERDAAVPWQGWRPIRGAPVHALSFRSQAPCCGKLYPCRLCHDGAEEHQLDRFRVSEVQCSRCRLLQKVGAGRRGRAQSQRGPTSLLHAGLWPAVVSGRFGWDGGKRLFTQRVVRHGAGVTAFGQCSQAPGGVLGAVLCGAKRRTW